MKKSFRVGLFGGIAGGLLLVGICFVVVRPKKTTGPVALSDVTGHTGITWRHFDGSSGRRYIVETVTAGLATFDYDGDGLIDIYFVNGAALRGTHYDKPPRNALYRNLGNFRFEDVTEQAGVGHTGFGLGVAAADYDNDGDQDLFVNNFGPNVLYRNNGDGTFTNVTEQAGVGGGNRVGAGAAFLDIDNDGLLDLYVANYVKFDYETHPQRTAEGYPVYPGPMDFLPEPDCLYRNNGDGTFTEVSDQSGIGQYAGTGMGMVCADVDNDGDTDIFVLNDVSGNFFFENDGKGHFQEVGLANGTAYNLDGVALGSMGVDCGDVDNDGLVDFYMTSYSGEMPALYRNLGGGRFEDVTLHAGAAAALVPHVNWGVGIVDFDNDGHRDLYIACGHLQDNAELFLPGTAYEVPNVLLWNTGNGKFVDISANCGPAMGIARSSRGAAFDDLDNDGRIDVVVLNSRREPTVLRNDTPGGNHWLQIRLRGTTSNRDGVGARVRVVAGNLTQWAQVHSGRGYQSHFGTRLHFGLANHPRADRVEVFWPSGTRDVLTDVPADQLLQIVEGTSSGAAARR